MLELGGSEPFIVLQDADLDKAVAGAVAGRMYNGGQACTASKRFIIVGDIYDEFLRRYAEAMSKITPGDPTDAQTTFGPLSSGPPSTKSPNWCRMPFPRARPPSRVRMFPAGRAPTAPRPS